MALYTKFQADVAPWWAQVPPRTLGDVVRTVSMAGLVHGAFNMFDMLQSSRQLVSVSALALKDFDASRRHLTACCTGKWILDGALQHEKSLGSGAFGTAQEKADLEAFLSAAPDDPPIYFGWGSMPVSNKAALAGVVVRALQMVNGRGIIVSGWSGVEQSHLDDAIAKEYGGDEQQIKAVASRIVLLKRVSHEFLFPKCACIVHHGGAGTCHAALRSGVPSIVAPFLFDQFPNADWIESMGCGMKVSQLTELEADVLAVAISEVLGDEAMKAKAKEVAGLMAEERGVPTAVELIEKWLMEPAPKTAIEEGPRSWKDGTYDTYIGGKRILKFRHKVSGNALLGTDGQLIGQIRRGDFAVQEDTSIDLPSGTYNVQEALPAFGRLLYGNIHDDGKGVTWHDGSSIRLVERADFCSVL